MAERSEQIILPDDWRDREDGLQLVIEELLSAYKHDDHARLLEFIRIGHEFTRSGLGFVAAAIAHVVAQKLLDTPPQELVSEDLADAKKLSSLVVRLAGSAPETELYGRLLWLSADIYRHVGENQLAIDAYRRAVALFDRLDQPASAASARQSLGALYFYANNLARAEEVTDQAEVIFNSLSDKRGLIEVRLNQVEYALARGDVAHAASLINMTEAPIHELRDGHLTASWRANSAIVDIRQGEVETARQKLLAALHSCRRRGDRELEVIVLQNLAKLTRETKGSGASIHWAQQALRVSQKINDQDREQVLTRSLAVNLVDMGRFDDAIALFRHAIDLNIQLDNPLGAAQSRADLGAAFLSKAFGLSQHGANTKAAEERDHALEIAVSTLTEAFEELNHLADHDWASRTAHNLQIAWTAQGLGDAGADYLERYAQETRKAAPKYSASLLRMAALLGLAAQRDGSWAVGRLLQAAERSSADPEEQAWQLVADATKIDRAYGDREGALTIYDMALKVLRHSPDQVGYANVLNDSALVAAALDRTDDARSRLLEVEALATASENRVLDALSKANLGELCLREGQDEAGRAYLTTAATLAAAVGDLEQASTAWASIANSLINTRDGLIAAKDAAARAAELAEQSGSNDAIARSMSALASISFAEGEYVKAHGQWLNASQSHPGERSEAYVGFALEALAQAGDWVRYSRELDRLTRIAQRSAKQLEFAEHLWNSSMIWLLNGSARRAAKPLAYSIMLAAEGYTKRERNPFNEGQVVEETSALISLVNTLAAAHTVMELDEVSLKLRDELHHQLAKQLIKVVGPEGAEMLMAQLDEVDQWVKDPS